MGQFLNYKLAWGVPSRPDSTWAAFQTRGRIYIFPEKTENYWWSKVNTIIENQKIINLLDNPSSQPCKCRTKDCVEINDDNTGMKSILRFFNWSMILWYFISKVETKDYSVMIDGKNFCDQPLKNDFRTYDNIQNIENGKGDNYTSGCLLDYPYFEDRYKMTAIDLSKQQVLDPDPKTILQINFSRNLDRDENTTIFFITEGAKETILGFSQGTVRVL